MFKCQHPPQSSTNRGCESRTKTTWAAGMAGCTLRAGAGRPAPACPHPAFQACHWEGAGPPHWSLQASCRAEITQGQLQESPRSQAWARGAGRRECATEGGRGCRRGVGGWQAEDPGEGRGRAGGEDLGGAALGPLCWARPTITPHQSAPGSTMSILVSSGPEKLSPLPWATQQRGRAGSQAQERPEEPQTHPAEPGQAGTE